MRIQRPDLVQRIVRRYGIVGAQGPDTIAPEIVPVSIVDVLELEGAEEVGCGMGANVQLAAAQYSQIQLLNPANSGVIALVDRVDLTIGGASSFVIGFYGTALPTATDVRLLDTRLTGTVPACKGYKDDGASKVIGVTTQFVNGYASGYHEFYPVELEGRVVLDEGQGIVVELTTVNVSLWSSIFWRERPKHRND